jgi:spore germination protein GerM
MTRRRGKPRLGKTGCLFWLFIFLVIIVIILYRGKGSFKDTFSNLRNRLSSQETQETGETEQLTVETPSPEDEGGVSADEPEPDIRELPEQSTAPVQPAPDREQTPEERSAREVQPDTMPTKALRAPLYFVKIEADGSARLQPAIRSITFRDSPITRTVEALVKGPSAEEASRGLISFIPEGTRLRSAQLKDGILTLDFSGAFEQNYNGREAILFQLSQVMLTSFEFSKVSGLTILIEGQRKGYITGEGIPLKEVYTKDDVSLVNTGG